MWYKGFLDGTRVFKPTQGWTYVVQGFPRWYKGFLRWYKGFLRWYRGFLNGTRVLESDPGMDLDGTGVFYMVQGF